MPGHGAWQRVKVRGPSAAGLELVRGFVKWGAASGACVDAVAGIVLVVGAASGGFGALFAENTELFWGC